MYLLLLVFIEILECIIHVMYLCTAHNMIDNRCQLKLNYKHWHWRFTGDYYL